MALHLRPLSDLSPNVLRFPNTAAESRKALVAHLENFQAALIDAHGIREGGLMFAEVAIAVMARKARGENAGVAMLFAVVNEFTNSAGLPPMTESDLDEGKSLG